MPVADNSPLKPRARSELKRRYFHKGYLWPWVLVILVPVLLRLVMFYDITLPFQFISSSTAVVMMQDELQLYKLESPPATQDDEDFPVIHKSQVIRPDEDAWTTHDGWINHVKDPLDNEPSLTETESSTERPLQLPVTKRLSDPVNIAVNLEVPEDDQEDKIIEGVDEEQLREIGERIEAIRSWTGQNSQDRGRMKGKDGGRASEEERGENQRRFEVRRGSKEVKAINEVDAVEVSGEDGSSDGKKDVKERISEKELEADEDKGDVEKRKAVERMAAEEKRKAMEKKEAEEKRKAMEKKEAEVNRKAAVKKEAEEKRKAAEKKEAEEKRKAIEKTEMEERKKATEEREAEEKKATEKREAEEKRKATEERVAEEERKSTEGKVADEKDSDANMERPAEETGADEKNAEKEVEFKEETKVAEEKEANEERRAVEERETDGEWNAGEERKAEEEKNAAEERESKENSGESNENSGESNENSGESEEQKPVDDQQEDNSAVIEVTEETTHADDQNLEKENEEKEDEKHEDSDPNSGEDASTPPDQTEEYSLPAGECDLFDGDWVYDSEGPLYTNETCFYIRGDHNCRSNGRLDTDFLNWRWKPRGCDLERFEAKPFMEKLRGKTIGFIGDSLARNQMQSFLCMLAMVEVPIEIYDDPIVTRWLYREYQITVTVAWSPYLLKDSREGIMGFEKGQSVLSLDVLDPVWTEMLPELEILVLSVGQWYFKPSVYVIQDEVIGCHYCPDLNLTDLSFVNAYSEGLRLTLEKLATGTWKGTALLSTFASAHTDRRDDGKEECRREAPVQQEEYESSYRGMNKEMRDVVWSEYARIRRDPNKLSEGVHIEFLDVSQLSLLRPDGHPGPYVHSNPYEGISPDEWVENDCLHWCLPGPADTWNQLLVKIVHKYY